MICSWKYLYSDYAQIYVCTLLVNEIQYYKKIPTSYFLLFSLVE